MRESWKKNNGDMYGRHFIKSTSIGYIPRDNHVIIFMTKGKQIKDCFVIIAECLAMCETILITIEKMFR